MTVPISTLFIVEDDPVLRSLLEELFVDSGYGVMSAGNDEPVTGMIRETRPDLILMDIRDSIDDRCAAAEALKQDPATGHIPIVALSDWPNLRQDPARSYLDHVVEKPYHPMVLLDQVKRTCEARVSRDQVPYAGQDFSSLMPVEPIPAIE